jgi:hypothetical protein
LKLSELRPESWKAQGRKSYCDQAFPDLNPGQEHQTPARMQPFEPLSSKHLIGVVPLQSCTPEGPKHMRIPAGQDHEKHQ